MLTIHSLVYGQHAPSQPRRHAHTGHCVILGTLTLQADGNSTGTGNPAGYCYKEQPAWSAYREPSFGHGTLDVINATTALWSVCLSVTLEQSACLPLWDSLPVYHSGTVCLSTTLGQPAGSLLWSSLPSDWSCVHLSMLLPVCVISASVSMCLSVLVGFQANPVKTLK